MTSERKEAPARRPEWLSALKRLFKSLQGRSGVIVREEKETIPEDFGWPETEEEYQRRQAEWLEGVRSRKTGEDRAGSAESREAGSGSYPRKRR